MSDPSLDRLSFILKRALHRASITKQARAKLVRRSKDREIADDYARRLAEKYLYRNLLSEERFDGLRFRWYFSNVQKDIPLDELRAWIDKKVVDDG